MWLYICVYLKFSWVSENNLYGIRWSLFLSHDLSISLGFSDNINVKSKSYLNVWKNTAWNCHIPKTIPILHANLERFLPGESTSSSTLNFQTMVMNPGWIFISNLKRSLFSSFPFAVVEEFSFLNVGTSEKKTNKCIFLPDNFHKFWFCQVFLLKILDFYFCLILCSLDWSKDI